MIKSNTLKTSKSFSDNELKTLCKELRNEVIDAVSVTGGHLGAGLGVVELTVAIHSVFNTPKDKLDMGCWSSMLPSQSNYWKKR